MKNDEIEARIKALEEENFKQASDLKDLLEIKSRGVGVLWTLSLIGGALVTVPWDKIKEFFFSHK